MKRLVNKFPREVGTPRKKFCPTEKDFYNFINRYNGISGCHVSIYHCDEHRKFHSTEIDKIVFDFDEEDSLKETIRMHEYLKIENIKHIMFFSGSRGFHVWVFSKDYKSIKIKVDCLTNAQMFFKNTLKFNVCKQMLGQIRKTIRIPNTFHLGGEKFCIPVTESDLLQGWDFICKKAKKQNFYFKFYGEKLFDLKKYDYPTPHIEMLDEVPKYEYEAVEKDGMVKHLLPCLRLMLLEPKEYCKYDSRRVFALGCKEHGLPPKTCDKLARKYWSKIKDSSGRATKYKEFVSEKWIDFVYRASEMLFPNCQTMFEKGFCKGKCEQYKAHGCPLYD